MISRAGFRYCLDPVCLGALCVYLSNRLVLKPLWGGTITFFRDYCNDMLCIPLFLPPVLMADRLLRLRRHDHPPTAFELALHWAIWSVCFELIAPRFPEIWRTTADPLDVVAYGAGAAIAGLCWGSWRSRHAPTGHLLAS